VITGKGDVVVGTERPEPWQTPLKVTMDGAPASASDVPLPNRTRSVSMAFPCLSWCVVATAVDRACVDAIPQCGVDAQIGVGGSGREAPSHEAILVADVEAKPAGPNGEMA
jgi:hypothetical protein